MKKSYLFILLLIIISLPHKGYAQNSILLSKTTVVPLIDGVLGEEWKDATEISLKGLTNQEAKVLIKYDDEYLYIAFQNLINNQHIRFNPEVLINTTLKDTIWNENSYWFHSSYSNCSAVGEYYNWEDCSKNPKEWKANTFPFKKGNNNIEFKISFSKLKTLPIKGEQIKVAFKLSNPLEQQLYWPESAIISEPSTWGVLKF